MKNISFNGKSYRLHLLDTAGQERFRTLSNSYYRNAHAIILMYDISNRDGFLSIDRWFDEVDENAMPGAVRYLAGCKKDKAGMGLRRVSEEEGLAKSKARGAIGWCEVSSKTRENVRHVFSEVLKAVVSDPELMKIGRRNSTGVSGLINVGDHKFSTNSAYGSNSLGSICSC